MKHSIGVFFALLAINAAAQSDKLSPNTEALLLRPSEKNIRSLSNNLLKAYVVLNDLKTVETLQRMGVDVHVQREELLTVQIPQHLLSEVAALDGVKYVEVASSVAPKLKNARKLGNADLAHSEMNPLGRAYLGKGVVVGIIDNGFEYCHSAYYSQTASDKRYRVCRVWNQNLTTGKSPALYNYGTEYTYEEELQKAQCDVNFTYHGGHVAGIAAGGNASANYYGVAPEADLVFVASGGTNVDITNAVDYIFNYAKTVGKPCVINMSIGSHYGPHDGTSSTDCLLDKLAGEGRLLVGACGNEGTTPLHLGKTFTDTDTSVKTMIGYADEGTKQALVDIWGTKGSHFTVKCAVVDLTKGRIVAETDAVSTTESGSYQFNFTTEETGADAYFTIVARSENAENGRPNIYIESTANHLAANRKLGFVIEGEPGAEVHAWNSLYGPFISGNKKGWTAGDTNYTVSEIGGTGHSVISVGSYNSQFMFTPLLGGAYMVNDENDLKDISSFSSCGPTLDGRTKPDVAAPGWCIVSAASKWAIEPTSAMERVEGNNGESCYYEINGGTSMAAPYVAGTLALWLEANPELSPADALQIIQKTAQSDDKTTDKLPNNAWGYGKIDTYAGLAMTLGHETGLQGISSEVEAAIRVVCQHDVLRVSYPALMGHGYLEVYSADGKIIHRSELFSSSAYNQMEVSTLKWNPGVYIVKVKGMQVERSFKISK